MEGQPCPICQRVGNLQRVDNLLSPDNEWRYYCPKCDIRFNHGNEILATSNLVKNRIMQDAGYTVVDDRYPLTSAVWNW